MPKRRTSRQAAASRRNGKMHKGTPVGKAGMVRLYHFTSALAADSIMGQQKLRGLGKLKNEIYFSDKRSGAASKYYGAASVSVRIPKTSVSRTKSVGNGELTHIVSTKNLAGVKIRRVL